MDPLTPAPRRVPFVALHQRDFRLLWGGQFISIAGSQMQVVALHVQVYQLAKGIDGANPALFLGLIGLMQLFPLLLFGLGAGVIADRFDRRKVLLITQSLLLSSSALSSRVRSSSTIRAASSAGALGWPWARSVSLRTR